MYVASPRYGRHHVLGAISGRYIRQPFLSVVLRLGAHFLLVGFDARTEVKFLMFRESQ